MNSLLQQLTEAVGISGEEKEIRRLIRDLIQEHVDEWRVDSLGNLIALKKGTGESDLQVMVDAHIDEVGLMVTDIDSDGTLRFAKVGGIDDRALLGKVVQVGPNKIIGVIGGRPVHLSTAEERDTVVKHRDMRIDIGAKKKDDAAAKINVGDRAAFVTQYEELGETALGKAFDNRAACAVLIELLRGDRYPFDLTAVFTVQEEVGLRGARVAGYAVQPDIALVLECTPAYDLPKKEDVSSNVMLGHGPAVYVMDSRTIQHPRFVAHIMQVAAAHNIPYQIRQPGGGGTNAGAIQPAHGGVPVASIAIPGRYPHTPNMIINLTDYANLLKLADTVLRSLQRNLFESESIL